jgi:glucose/arabinose dehydrogenase
LKLRLLAIALVIAGCGSGGSEAAITPAEGAVRLHKVGSFDEPVYVTAPPADKSRVFVVEKGGTVRVVKNGKKLSRPFLDVRNKVTTGSEQGLLSLAFAPDYASSGLFYVYYTDVDGNTQVVEYKRAGEDVADPASARTVLSQAQPEPNHNGGLLLFGPDKLLYVGLGDGGGGGDQHGARGNAQSLGTILGKILRIDPRADGSSPYRIPADNPFVGRSGARGEIYSYGLRNPWRFSFDRKTGDLTIGDVGQEQVEEIDFVRKGKGRGANFGWRVFEGNHRYTPGESAPGAIKPVITEKHSDGNCSITGGVVIRDPKLPAWAGRYVFGDFCRGEIETAVLSTGRARNKTERKLHVDQLSSFGEDASGRVYVTSLDGPVYRLAQ